MKNSLRSNFQSTLLFMELLVFCYTLKVKAYKVFFLCSQAWNELSSHKKFYSGNFTSHFLKKEIIFNQLKVKGTQRYIFSLLWFYSSFLTFFPSWKSFILPSAFLRDRSSFMLSKKSWYCFCSAMFLGWLPIFCWISHHREHWIMCFTTTMSCRYYDVEYHCRYNYVIQLPV